MLAMFWIYLLLGVATDTVSGQGRLLSPPGRSSLWRFGYGTPENNNDNVLSCGGIKHRWEVNKGKCGVCGDPWDNKPRDNEAGGLYAKEIVSGVYKSGTYLQAIVDVANANGGYFEFRLCPNNNFSSPVKEECLNKGILTLEDGVSTRFDKIHDGMNIVMLKLPDDLTCDQCVLQWKYRSADQYGCEESTGSEKKCGFGLGEMQTEYYACADIAIYSDISEHDNFGPSAYNVDTTGRIKNLQNDTSSFSIRPKRAAHMFHYERNTGIRFSPAFQNGMQLQFESKPLRSIPDQSQIKWMWSIRDPNGGNRQRRQMNVPEGISIANPHLNGIIPSLQNGAGRVRSSFNQRRNGPVTSNGVSINNIIVPEPVVTKTQSVRTISRPIAKISVKRVKITKPVFSVNTVTNTQQGSPVLSLPKPTYKKKTFGAHRNFIDPLATQVSSQTQRVLSRSNYKPTKQCQHCPFDQCLDDKLRIDHLFPGLFDSPTQFFECKRFERVFTLGNYDVVQEGLPSCQHPRFKRQLSAVQFDDDDIGCCATRPQVILPLTVEAENDTFSVVQLGDAKKQFIVQGICGNGWRKSNTTSCTVCAAENNFQWVLVYDPRVNTNPPVSFVPVKFPHYCRCYNYMQLKG